MYWACMWVIFLRILVPIESTDEESHKLFKRIGVVLHLCHVDKGVKVFAVLNVSLFVFELHSIVIDSGPYLSKLTSNDFKIPWIWQNTGWNKRTRLSFLAHVLCQQVGAKGESHSIDLGKRVFGSYVIDSVSDILGTSCIVKFCGFYRGSWGASMIHDAHDHVSSVCSKSSVQRIHVAWVASDPRDQTQNFQTFILGRFLNPFGKRPVKRKLAKIFSLNEFSLIVDPPGVGTMDELHMEGFCKSHQMATSEMNWRFKKLELKFLTIWVNPAASMSFWFLILGI